MFMGPSFWWGPSPFDFFFWNSYQVNFKPYRGTSLIRNCLHPRITVGHQA